MNLFLKCSRWIMSVPGNHELTFEVNSQSLLSSRSSFVNAIHSVFSDTESIQKQLSRGVFKKKYSENMLQSYRRTPMPRCDFNKVALHLY